VRIATARRTTLNPSLISCLLFPGKDDDRAQLRYLSSMGRSAWGILGSRSHDLCYSVGASFQLTSLPIEWQSSIGGKITKSVVDDSATHGLYRLKCHQLERSNARSPLLLTRSQIQTKDAKQPRREWMAVLVLDDDVVLLIRRQEALDRLVSVPA